MEDLDKAIQDQPRSGSTYSLRALAWVELGDVEKALTDAKKAIEHEPESAGCHCVYALILAGGIQDHGGAMVEFDQAIKLDPKNPQSYFGRARCWQNLKETDKAIADFNESLRLYPECVETLVCRGDAWLRKGDLDRAEADLSEAIRLAPSVAPAYINRAYVWGKMGKPEKAIQDYDSVVELDGKNVDALLGRGIALAKTEQVEKALADLDQAVELNPKNATIYFNRGMCRAQKEEYGKALEDYEMAIRLSPGKAQYLQLRAWLWATCPDDKYRDADKALDYAIHACEKYDWKSSFDLMVLAAVYTDKGLFEKAVEFQELALTWANDPRAKATGQEMLACFKAGKPYRTAFPR